MTKAAAKSGGGKPAAFKKQGKGVQPTMATVTNGNKGQLANIKQLAGVKGSPKKAPTMTPAKNGNKAQLDNLRKWGASKGTQGDNPYSSGK